MQAQTQFQGPGSCHDLAALLLTEAVQHSLHTARLPVYVLLLDAKSAFDKVVLECAVRNAYLAGTRDQGLLYLNSRLQNRRTYVEWDKVLMGPICDSIGVEQGGVNSDRLYKLCNNVQLQTAQLSQLGVVMGAVIVSSIGQADDTALVSNCLTKLCGLLHLAVQYCKNYHVELVPEKTKRLAFHPSGKDHGLYIQELLNPRQLDGHRINFSSSAEHVGILRSIEGNMPHVLSRLSAHTRAIGAILHTGMAGGHYGNPAASMRLQRLYGCPVLLSGLASLVLNKAEMSVIHHHLKVHLERILKLHKSTPECVVMFLAGSLPASALLHLKMLGLLGMIAHLGRDNILHQHGCQVLLSNSPGKSWFSTLRSICKDYGLPDPLLVLQSPPSKDSWKRMTKSKVIDFWEVRYRAQATLLPSLKYFNSNYMSLTSPHPIFEAARSPFEVRKTIVVAKMLSGRYRTDQLVRHWSKTNPLGLCLLPGCDGKSLGTLEHILLYCQALKETRSHMMLHWFKFLSDRPYLFPLIVDLTSNESNFMQLLLDPSSIPSVKTANILQPDCLKSCFYLSRTWVYSHHQKRTSLQKTWKLI